MNNTNSEKYGIEPETVEIKSLKATCLGWSTILTGWWKFKKCRQKSKIRSKIDSRKKNKVRVPLDIGEKVLTLAERVKKKDALEIFFNRVQQEKKSTKVRVQEYYVEQVFLKKRSSICYQKKN